MSSATRPSPLAAARPAVAAAFCLSLGACAFIISQPLIVAALAAIILACAASAGVGHEVWRTARWMIPLTLFIVVINAIVVRDGFTVIVRLGDLGPLGQVDITLEALVYGAVFGLRLLVVAMAFALMTATVDPDAILRGLRRLSVHSALAATLATRFVPVLRRDATRLGEAQRCRAGASPSRTVVMRAVTVGALDRALDLAATLELRGYATARRPPRVPVLFSRHDFAFMTASLALLIVASAGQLAGLADFSAYPQLHAAPLREALAVSAALALCALAPFIQRRGIGR